MVVYFSATGNTEFIAKELAKKLNDECINILDKVKKQDYSELRSDKPYVICAPVYVCEMPRFMSKYLKEQKFTGSNDVYFIFTSGGYAGISGWLAESLVKKKGMTYKGHAEFKMPRNYVANDHYPMLEKEEIESRILNSYNQIKDVADTILSGGNLIARHIALWEILVTVPFNPVWCKFKLKAKDFYVKDNCIGCSKCQNLCPLNNIKLVDGKPTWGDDCTHCMACIGNCPVEAIEYGEITKEKRPYNFGKYKNIIDSSSK